MIFVLFLLLPVSSPLFTHGYTCTHAHTPSVVSLRSISLQKGPSLGQTRTKTFRRGYFPFSNSAASYFRAAIYHSQVIAPLFPHLMYVLMQSRSDTRYNVNTFSTYLATKTNSFPRQDELFLAEMNLFIHRDELVYLRRRTCLSTEMNSFIHKDELIYSRRLTHLLTDMNLFTCGDELVYSQRRTRLLAEMNSFTRRDELVYSRR